MEVLPHSGLVQQNFHASGVLTGHCCHTVSPGVKRRPEERLRWSGSSAS